ncbi:hypothetical protein [Calycomorphotria hydatis]|uniref:Uncharacterized protein n=1 Tax=Calycomorphotria hydatis TaxID=2528027 RepID=A0A517TDS5_9PLAN|nr:hypothetical protein [Calycomorphotria hydatis]QDT66526.1 hypothetical protein V22_37960 [Calycomorphotria hydatis]
MSSALTLAVEVEEAKDEMDTVDVIEEMRLRTWARKNYVSSEDRDDCWHPIILDEMERIDRDAE